MESRFPEELAPALTSLERNGSPWAFSASDRAQWAEGMDIPTMAELVEKGEKADILFWVGCMGSFDDRAKKITVAFARILQAANVRFAILGQEETCHGDPARRMGNEYLYQMLAKGVIEKSVEIEGAKGLNDVTVDAAGVAIKPLNWQADLPMFERPA